MTASSSPNKNTHTAPRVGISHLKRSWFITKQNRSLTEQVFGIGRYTYSKNGDLYFVHDNCRIKVTEHFSEAGKPMSVLLEDLIQFSVKQKDDEIHPAC